MIKVKTETETLFADLDKPSLHVLSYILRHPDTWPDGFFWDFSQCENCAMGLAHALWQKYIPRATNETGPSLMAKKFAIPYSIANKIFMGEGPDRATYTTEKTYPRRMRTGFCKWEIYEEKLHVKIRNSQVTPEMVADQIDAYLGAS